MFDDYSACTESAQLNHALLYSQEFGWRVVPCYTAHDGVCSCKSGADCGDPGKHPRLAKYLLNATDCPKQIAEWWARWPSANVGIVTGSGLVVIDVDFDRGGAESLARLEAELGPLPRSLVVRTGRGLHVYLAVPRTVQIRSSELEGSPGIDIKAEGGFVVAPPSLHASGRLYQWESLQLGGPDHVPAAWLDAVPRAHSPALATVPESVMKSIAAAANAKADRENIQWVKTSERWVRRHRITGARLTPEPMPESALKITGTGGRGIKGARQAPKPRRVICALSQDDAKLSRSRHASGSTSASAAQGGMPPKAVCEAPAVDGLLSPFGDPGKRVWAAVRRCVLTEVHTTNTNIVALATSLKNIPELAHEPAEVVRPAVHFWWERSHGFMRVKAWDRVWKRFRRMWNRWAKPEFGPVWRARALVLTSPLPPAALKYQKPAKQHLVALCYAIQAEAGAGVWYLSWRSAHDALISMGHKISLAGLGKWLREFVRDGVLVQPWKHERGSLWAQRYLTAEIATTRVKDPIVIGSFSEPTAERKIA